MTVGHQSDLHAATGAKSCLKLDVGELAETITLEFAELRGEFRRAIENVEAAGFATALTQGLFSEVLPPE